MRRQEQRLAVGYLRVSTAEQGQSGLGLEAQRAAIHSFAHSQGWSLVAEFEDIACGKDDQRAGFQAALARCRQLGAVLVAARLDRITRRAHTLSQLLEDGVSTCKLNGVDPQRYFAEVLARLVNGWPNSRIDELMPWCWAPTKND